MGKLIHICIGLALVSPLLSQSATNFDTRTLAPEKVSSQDPGAKPTAKAPGPATATPSRDVSPDEIDTYLSAMSSVFLSRGRTTDPFGLPQDPDAKPVIKASPASINRPAPVKATPFPDIIALLEINTIMPGTRSFLIKTRSVKQGETLPLSFRNKTIRAHVVAV
ncbi:MAG: hypothetical protein EOP85_08350, partial [Verrucomicrobiaceae bacterium]